MAIYPEQGNSYSGVVNHDLIQGLFGLNQPILQAEHRLINLAIKYRILRILLSTLEMLAKMYEFFDISRVCDRANTRRRHFHVPLINSVFSCRVNIREVAAP